MKSFFVEQKRSICDLGWLRRNSCLGTWSPLAVCCGEHEKQLLFPQLIKILLTRCFSMRPLLLCWKERCVRDPINTLGGVGKVPTVGPGCAGGVTKWDGGAETGTGRAAVLDLAFLGAYGRNMAAISSYTSPCGGLQCENLYWYHKRWRC